jgi:hydroxyacylglutathione hydrolase
MSRCGYAGRVLVAGFPSGAFQANCFVLAPDAGEACVVVDPGQDAEGPLERLLREHRLTPVAVLLTHGHFDHVFSVTPVCDGNDIPAWIHPDDRMLLSDPLKGFSTEALAFFGGRLTMREPREVRTLDDGAELELAGLQVTVDHTPAIPRGRWCSVPVGRMAGSCWPATPSSPDRSDAPTCRAGTRRRSWSHCRRR